MTKKNTGPGNTGPVPTGPPRPRHRLSDVDEVMRVAVCSVCGPTGITKNVGAYRCSSTRRAGQQVGYAKHKTDVCSWCQRKWHRVQMDCDHYDNDHSNNSVENLISMCANCHRLKSWLVQVGIPKNEWKAWAAKYQPRTPSDQTAQ